MAQISHTTTDRRSHPNLPELVGGLDLSRNKLAEHPDESQIGTLMELLTNAEYWLSYEPEAFDNAVLKTPSPLRELGIGIGLRFGQSLDGELAEPDIEACRQQLAKELPPELFKGIERGLHTLSRVIKIRNKLSTFTEQGYRIYEATNTLSVHALRASGRATIKIDGRMVASSQTDIKIGQSIKLAALDENARALSLPEINDKMGGSIYVRDDAQKEFREFIFTVPGLYRVTVPSRSEGGHKLFVS